nr:40S ribosomal protein S12 [Hymenolepis microstoma]
MDAVEISFDAALREVLKNALAVNGLIRGIHQCTRAIEKRDVIVCFLSETCDESTYTDIIEALCQEYGVPLIKLGEMAGLCKLDRKGLPRKVVSVSCVGLTDFGEDSNGWKYFVEKHNISVVVS